MIWRSAPHCEWRTVNDLAVRSWPHSLSPPSLSFATSFPMGRRWCEGNAEFRRLKSFGARMMQSSVVRAVLQWSERAGELRQMRRVFLRAMKRQVRWFSEH